MPDATARTSPPPPPPSPDAAARGLTGSVDALRYDGHTRDPVESAGLLARLLKSVVPPGGRILDVGCGTGSVSRIVGDETAAEVFGVEPDARRAELARQRGLTVFTGTLGDLPGDHAGGYDAVVFADVLEHLSEPLAALSSAIPHLRPGGHVAASIPNVAHWSVRLNLLAGRFDYAPVGLMDATHLRWFTQRTVTRLFADAGLELIRIDHTAGTSLPVYHEMRGVRRIPQRFRDPAVRRLALAFPRLFGCQHVVLARAAGGAGVGGSQ